MVKSVIIDSKLSVCVISKGEWRRSQRRLSVRTDCIAPLQASSVWQRDSEGRWHHRTVSGMSIQSWWTGKSTVIGDFSSARRRRWINWERGINIGGVKLPRASQKRSSFRPKGSIEHYTDSKTLLQPLRSGIAMPAEKWCCRAHSCAENPGYSKCLYKSGMLYESNPRYTLVGKALSRSPSLFPLWFTHLYHDLQHQHPLIISGSPSHFKRLLSLF